MVKKSILTIMVLSIVAKIFGYLQQFVLAYIHGTSTQTDIFIVSISIPMLIVPFVGRIIKNGLIPQYYTLETRHGKQSADNFVFNITVLLTVIFLLVIVVVMIFSENIINIIAPGFNEEMVEMSAIFLRITIFSIIFSSFTGVLHSLCHIKGIFWAPAITSLPMSILLSLFIILSAQNIYYLPIGFVVASFSQLLVFIPVFKKIEFKPMLNIKLFDKNISSFLIIVFPLFFTTMVSDLKTMIDRIIGSLLETGSISALNYAASIISISDVIIGVSIATVMFPAISKLIERNEKSEIKSIINENFIYVSMLATPLSIYIIIFNYEIVELLFGRGEFGQDSIVLTSTAVAFFSLNLLPRSVKQVIHRVFYAYKKFHIPLIANIINLALNLILNLIFITYTNLGIGGIALATSISGMITFVILLIILKSKLNISFYNSINKFKVIVYVN